MRNLPSAAHFVALKQDLPCHVLLKNLETYYPSSCLLCNFKSLWLELPDLISHFPQETQPSLQFGDPTPPHPRAHPSHSDVAHVAPST